MPQGLLAIGERNEARSTYRGSQRRPPVLRRRRNYKLVGATIDG